MFAQEIGRKAAIVNLDFANDNLLYNVAIDVRKFLTLQVFLIFLCHLLAYPTILWARMSWKNMT